MEKVEKGMQTPFARALRSLRFDQRLLIQRYKQCEVANKLGISPSRMSDFEMGRAMPNERQFKDLLAVYRISRERFAELVDRMSVVE